MGRWLLVPMLAWLAIFLVILIAPAALALYGLMVLLS
jgi:hypothetical protein